MSRRTNTWNAYESALSGPLAIGATSVAVDSAVGLVEPVYLVIDPDDPTKVEWIRVNTITGNTLENLVRGLEGSNGAGSGGVEHEAGAKIRAVYSKQIQDDIFSDIEDGENDLSIHIADAADPHAAAGYLKLTTGDARYILETGDTMQGALSMGSNPLTNLVSPTDDADAVTKQYADNLAAGGFNGNHDSLTNVTSAQHHTKYTDGEAVSAMGALNDNNDLNHNRYTDAEAEAAIAAEDLYYTKAEVNSLLNGKSDVGHTHAAADTISGAFADARIPNLNASKTTAGVFSVARIPDLNASKIDAGTFGAGNYTFPGSVGIAGAFNANTTVSFPGLAVSGAGVELRLNGGNLTKAT